jgi:hypothetical protein
MNTFSLMILGLATFFLAGAMFCLMRVMQFGKRVALGLPSLIPRHKKWVNRFLLSLIPPVLLIEALVRINKGRLGGDELFLVHMVFVVLMVLTLLVLRFVVTGVVHSKAHRTLTRFFFMLFSGVFFTGVALVLQLITTV